MKKNLFVVIAVVTGAFVFASCNLFEKNVTATASSTSGIISVTLTGGTFKGIEPITLTGSVILTPDSTKVKGILIGSSANTEYTIPGNKITADSKYKVPSKGVKFKTPK
ncbi:hypothetical protein PilKf_02231 [Pillotina sp. SPG140]|jgi:hypothetical protein